MKLNNDIELREYESYKLAERELDNEQATTFWQDFCKPRYLSLSFPSPVNNMHWVFTAGSTLGYFPFTKDRGVRVLPKVSVSNVLKMLEYAYNTPPTILDKISHPVSSLEDVYSYLAYHLAELVLTRAKHGFAKAYRHQQDRLPFVRGRIDVLAQLRQPASTRLYCHYQDHTLDIHDNQVLRWTLFQLSRSSLRDYAQKRVKLAQHVLAPNVSVVPIRAVDAVAPYYDRLRQDYRPMHNLCRLFLDNLAPTIDHGNHKTVPILIVMYRLFEKYVTAILRRHLGTRFVIDAQEHISLEPGISFNIDIVIYAAPQRLTAGSDNATKQALIVLDSKYKHSSSPSSHDIQQVVAYAEVKNCQDAVLIYPQHVERTLEVGTKKVHLLGIDISENLDVSAQAFCAKVEKLLMTICSTQHDVGSTFMPRATASHKLSE